MYTAIRRIVELLYVLLLQLYILQYCVPYNIIYTGIISCLKTPRILAETVIIFHQVHANSKLKSTNTYVTGTSTKVYLLLIGEKAPRHSLVYDIVRNSIIFPV